MKAELQQHHAFGVRLYTAFVEAAGAKGKRLPPWQTLDDVNVLRAVKEADEFWCPLNHPVDLIIRTYLNEFIGAPAMLRFQSLTGSGRNTIRENIRKDIRSAAAALRGSQIISETDAVCQTLVQEADIELMLDYARGILKAQTGTRGMTAAALPIMIQPVGNIPAWVRCFMSGNHPDVLRAYGQEAAEQFRYQPNLKIHLTRYGYDASPVLTYTPT